MLHVDRPHTLSGDEVVARLDSTLDGLSAGEVRRRLAAVGTNRLPAQPKQSLARRLLKQFQDVLIYILIAAAVVTAALGHWLDTGVILGVVVINALVGLVQEGKAEKALEGIRQMLSPHAEVCRGGEWLDVDAEQLVPGDIVRLRSGVRVPADVRLLEVASLRVEESALTGESVPVTKGTGAVAEGAGVGDRICMAYSGTLVAAGRGIAVVTATGSRTEIGRINRMLSEVETLATPLTREMNRFGRVLSVAILGLAALLFVIGVTVHSYGIGEVFLAAIGFVVAAIPEGLPAVLTITLALGVQRMARRNAITRKLNAIETLGAVTVICSDKTGTLTKNEMTVRYVVTATAAFEVSGTGYAPKGEVLRAGLPVSLAAEDALRALIEVMAVANEAEIAHAGERWSVVGEPTEGALRVLAHKAGFATAGYQRIAAVPFESEAKYMATLEQTPGGARRILCKGAPDRLLERCVRQRVRDGEDVPIDRPFWEQQIAVLGAQGLRVLAAAVREVEAEKSALSSADLESDLTFLGLVGIVDPPRPEAITAIAACQRAGIQVKMITGDHADTARTIGREMGIGDGIRVITGAALEAASNEALVQLVGEYDVFARTSPEHKLRLVQALQARGEVVAMTGDGVNDAPALKRANVGIAMGIKGTEAAKEAADIVLADDNFASIERAVEEGRAIYDNLRKAILFILPTNGAESLVMLAAVSFGLVLPLTPVQILWVNMVTAVTLALALAFEPAEPGVMTRPPRAPGAPILGGVFVWRVSFVSLLIGGCTLLVFQHALAVGEGMGQARTLAVNTIVFGELVYLFNTRFLDDSSLRPSLWFTNRAAWLAVLVLTVLQILFVYMPFMNRWFGSMPLAPQHWVTGSLLGACVFLVIEVEKAILRRLRRPAR